MIEKNIKTHDLTFSLRLFWVISKHRCFWNNSFIQCDQSAISAAHAFFSSGHFSGGHTFQSKDCQGLSPPELFLEEFLPRCLVHQGVPCTTLCGLHMTSCFTFSRHQNWWSTAHHMKPKEAVPQVDGGDSSCGRSSAPGVGSGLDHAPVGAANHEIF